jgi:hypothetical protein
VFEGDIAGIGADFVEAGIEADAEDLAFLTWILPVRTQASDPSLGRDDCLRV